MIPLRFAAPSGWRDFGDLIDKASPELRRALYRALAGLQDSVDMQVLAHAIDLGSVTIAGDSLDLEGFQVALQTDVASALRGALLAGGSFAVDGLADRPDLANTAAVKALGGFDLTDPRALEWIDQEAGSLVRNITEEQRSFIVDAVHKAFAAPDVPPAKLARQIRQRIGLTTRQQTAVASYHDRLAAQEARGELRAGWADTLTDRYAATSLRYRSGMIASQETSMAANAGRAAGWNQAVAGGALDPTAVVRVWLVSGLANVCPLCRLLNGKQAALTGTYPDGTIRPPRHIRCSCTEGLVRVGTSASYGVQTLPPYAPRGSGLKPRIPQAALFAELARSGVY